MSIERIRLSGLQSRDLEVGRKRVKSTPTTDRDITPRATAYKRMMNEATFHTMAMEGSHSVPDQLEASQEALRAIRRDVVVRGHDLSAFDQIVRDNVTLAKRKAEDEASDARLIEETESERQAFIGETPVNWGNHAKKADAGGFETRRRGW